MSRRNRISLKKRGMANLCGKLSRRLCHNWRLLSYSWSSGKVKNQHFSSFLFVQGMTPKASTLVPYLTFWKQGVVMPAHPSHLPKESRFTTVVNQYTCLFPNQGILVTGGTNNFEKLSSTEFFLPSNGLWKRGGELPR